MITVGRRRAEKGQCLLHVDDIAQHAAGSLGIWLPRSDVFQPAQALKYKEAFGSRLFTAIELHREQDDAARRERLKELALQYNAPLAAANDVHYHVPERRFLQDVLVCIREGCSIQTAGKRLFSNAERYLKSARQMSEVLGPGSDEWIARSIELADECHFSLDELRYDYPEELAPPGMKPMAYLVQLTWEGARRHWPAGVSETVRAQIEHELALIEELRYEAYFLTVYDLVRFARSRDILCQGRGSAANSAVCYCLGITAVDPARSNALFERFISRERDEAPDIDVDFEHERREEVLQYVYEKYGRERAGIVAEVIKYRAKSAARDVAKALGFSLDLVERLAESFDRWDDSTEFPERIEEANFPLGERTMQQYLALTREILGFPRHLGQHVGGFVITQGPLCELSPIENASMEGRTVIEWDKDDIDELGILKVDCLSLGMLTCIHRAFNLLRKQFNRDLTLATIPAEDPQVYEMCCRADTLGVFQIESRAQMAMLPRLQPKCFYDLVIEVSIVRPGPIQGGMVHPYLRRRAGEEAVTFPNDALKDVLGKTMGVPLFQEQVMRLAVVAAGFTPGEADILRRSISGWRRTDLVEKHRLKFIDGMLKNGYTPEFAHSCFEQIRGFGEYGFPESHAASFALLVYGSAWLKCHYPAVFTCALLNSQPMGFYAPAQLIRDAQTHGVEVRPVDVNFSDWDCMLEGDKIIRLGLREIHRLSIEQHARPLLAARDRPFVSPDELARRTGLAPAALALFAGADAFRSMGIDRRDALWKVMAQHEGLPLFEDLDAEEPEAEFPMMQLQEHVNEDYLRTGLSLKAHPVSFVREQLAAIGSVSCAELERMEDGAQLRVAGIVLVRQRPDTAVGVTFFTLEDETGQANFCFWPAVFARFRLAGRGAAGLIVDGRLQKAKGVTHVIVQRLTDFTELIPDLKKQSRDFH